MVNCAEVANRGMVCDARGHTGLRLDQIKGMRRDGALCKGCCLFTLLANEWPRPPLECYKLRTPDHRFEWSRIEFREWAYKLAKQHGYSVRFDGVGGGDLDEVRRPGEQWHGPGPSSQVAIFERNGENDDEEWGDFVRE